jgi:hypothetical protein
MGHDLNKDQDVSYSAEDLKHTTDSRMPKSSETTSHSVVGGRILAQDGAGDQHSVLNTSVSSNIENMEESLVPQEAIERDGKLVSRYASWAQRHLSEAMIELWTGARAEAYTQTLFDDLGR